MIHAPTATADKREERINLLMSNRHPELCLMEPHDTDRMIRIAIFRAVAGASYSTVHFSNIKENHIQLFRQFLAENQNPR